MAISCTKEEPHNNTATDSDSSQDQICRMLNSKGYDQNGNLTSETRFYYHGNKIDSSSYHSASGDRLSSIHYKYLNNTERELRYVDIDGLVAKQYSLQKLDLHGNILEYKNFDNNGVITSRVVSQFLCD